MTQLMGVALTPTLLARSESIENRGPAIFFKVIKGSQIFPAFAIRFRDRLRAYLNVCPHMGLRLNRDSNSLFHMEKNYLFCRAHGAAFDAQTGKCVIGPCLDHGLIALRIEETDGSVFYPRQEYRYYA